MGYWSLVAAGTNSLNGPRCLISKALQELGFWASDCSVQHCMGFLFQGAYLEQGNLASFLRSESAANFTNSWNVWKASDYEDGEDATPTCL